jgi:acyl-CoA reductase-like NAD-dependent aldehyde dehydrogenase
VESFIQDAINKGAKVELGGKRIKQEGLFFEPTILTNLTKDMLVCCEEPFGPIMPIIPFSNNEEAVEIANSTEYGLGGSVWSKDTKKAKEMAKKLVSGTAWVNDVALPFVHAPYGGLRKSGMLKEMGREGIRDLCDRKVISVPMVHLKTRQWWFPVDEKTRLIMKDFAKYLARKSLFKKTKALTKIIRDLFKYGRMG